MKLTEIKLRFFLVILLLTLISNEIYSNSKLNSLTPKYNEMKISIFSEKLYYSYHDEIKVILTIKNICNHVFFQFPVLPIEHRFGNPPLKFEYSGSIGNFIEWDYLNMLTKVRSSWMK